MPRRFATIQARSRRGRAALLVSLVLITVAVAACGRATEEEINQALGITPTPTESAEQIAAATERAESAAATREAAIASGSPESGGVAALAGNPARGQTQYSLYCLQCHGPAGQGPNILEPGNPAAAMTYEELLTLVREGTGHGVAPIPNYLVSDQSLADIHAYIEAQAGS
jgi:mono/diheme cytochrome c family protein